MRLEFGRRQSALTYCFGESAAELAKTSAAFVSGLLAIVGPRLRLQKHSLSVGYMEDEDESVLRRSEVMVCSVPRLSSLSIGP